MSEYDLEKLLAAERRSYDLIDEENLCLKVPTSMLDPI